MNNLLSQKEFTPASKKISIKRQIHLNLKLDAGCWMLDAGNW
jgi:hypothetical protein